jgi:integrating conjugative element protein (TIGR03757 family)
MIKLFIPLLLLLSTTVNALTLEVITNQPNQIRDVATLRQQGVIVNIYDLTAGDRMANAMSNGLTGPDNHALQQVQQRIAGIGRKHFETQLKQAFQAIIQSVAYQLDRHPAVVFNQGEAVVYGVTELNTAVGYYQHWKTRQ